MAIGNSRGRSWHFVKGVTAGTGIGLLGCDWIDLHGGDKNALYGWFTSICCGALFGGVIGIRRRWRDSVADSPSLESNPAKWNMAHFGWQILGAAILTQGIIGVFSATVENRLMMIWAIPMVSAGTLYITIPAIPSFAFLLRQRKSTQ